MAKDILGKADEQVAESIRKLTRATSAMVDAIDEGTDIIKHAIKRSGDVAEELLDDTTQRFKRHPIETMAATFALGVVVGGFLGWLVARR
jgi:F0F1-type ATP synthase assembly protein I